MSRPQLSLIRSTFINTNKFFQRKCCDRPTEAGKHNAQDRCERQQSTPSSGKLEPDLMQQAKLKSETNYT